MTQPLPLTYADWVDEDDVDPLGKETTSDLQNLIQDVIHVIEEDLGSNPDDPKRGVGIRSRLGGTLDDLNGLQGTIEEQLSSDVRITGVACSISAQDSATFPYLVNLQIQVSGQTIGLTLGYQQSTGRLVQQ